MTDNPAYGDERLFAQVRPENETNAAPTATQIVKPGQRYTAYIYFKNDASPGSADSTAKNVRLTMAMPAVVHGSANAVALLSADNVAPKQIWDSFTLALPDPSQEAVPRYVPNSAVIHVGGRADGQVLDEKAFFSDGVPLGCDSLNGDLPANDSCSGYVSFDFQVDQPNFTVDATARVKGTDAPFSANVAAAPGDVLEVRVEYANTGTTEQKNVLLRLPGLPPELHYVKGSSVLANANSGGNYHPITDAMPNDGVNVGTYDPPSNVFVKFDLLVDKSLTGPHWLTVPSFVRAETNNGNKDAPLSLEVLG